MSEQWNGGLMRTGLADGIGIADGMSSNGYRHGCDR